MRLVAPRAFWALLRTAALLSLALTSAVVVTPIAAASPPEPLWTDAPRPRNAAPATLRQDTFETIARDASPGVVNIEVELGGGLSRAQVPTIGQGTGFVIHPDGYIVTNAHVVRGSDAIRVTTSRRKVFAAEIVGLDSETDIALIRIVEDARPADGFHALLLADSSIVRAGQWVLAIGNPFGLSHTVTAGIVSAVGRRDMLSQLRLAYADFIQIDAAINFGNSGGPLLNLHGHVVGMNTAIQSGNDIGFAIPTNMIREVLPQLAQGEVLRAWSGLSFGDLSAEDARVLPQGRQGARIQNLHAAGPGMNAGLQIGDIILGFNHREVEDAAQLRWWIASSPLDTPARFDVLRDGDRVTVEVTLLERPPAQGINAPSTSAGRQARPDAPSAQPPGRNQPQTSPPVGPTALGVSVTALDRESGAGVRVIAVEAGGAAALAGLRPGDILTHLNDTRLTDPEDFIEAAQEAENERRYSMRVQRGDAQIFLHVRVAAP